MTEHTALNDEGVIKYRLDFTPSSPLAEAEVALLNDWRRKLFQRKLIGQDPLRYGGYGYGNVSMRLEPLIAPPPLRRFVISGSQTGDLVDLGAEHYTVVSECYPAENRLVASGPIRPSSESLTHGALYALDATIGFVFHVHTPVLWLAAAKLAIPITDENVPYGTPAMAAEVARLYATSDLAERRIFSMGGHEDGIVTFGKTAEEAGAILLSALDAAQ